MKRVEIRDRAHDPARHRARTCRGKKRYKRKSLAEDAAHWSSGRSGGDFIVAYLCRYCQGWHIGHIRKAERTMDANEYQKHAMSFSVAHDRPELRLINAVVGIAGEGGELAALLRPAIAGDEVMRRLFELVAEVGTIAEAVKKARFHGHDLDYDAATKAITTARIYAARLANAIAAEVRNGPPEMADVTLEAIDPVLTIKETGDVRWYTAQAADAINVSLSRIDEANIAKLSKRYQNGFSTEASVNRSE